MSSSPRLAAGAAVVFASMVVLFTVPRDYFAAATFFSTGCMLAATVWVNSLGSGRRLRARSVALGLVTAALLYFVFYLGAAAVDALHPFGLTSASESAIYSLIASPSNPLSVQVALLLFDSAGYESFFRGALQSRLEGRIGVAAAPVVAVIDASIHVITLNPLWVGATFVTDLVWGLTYFYGKGFQSSFTSHIAWDIAIFIIRPVT